ncbi:M48 family metallopeptidase [Lichenicoccus sp.]|uniref:M48 family metallopeptidase n=1 Tax=Lichenicoccus sp. TaxID=2781899 RepID=UPI003D13C600
MHVPPLPAPLLIIVLLASLAETLLSLWLSRRQIAHVRAHCEQVPADFAHAITVEQHRRAAEYTVARERLAMVRQVWQWLVGAAWLLVGFDLLYGLLAAATPPSLGRSVGFVLAYAAIGALLALPFSLYGTFVVEQGFGFNRTTPALYARDRLRGWGIGLLLATPLLFVAFWLIARVAGLWWLYGWLGLVVLMLGAPAVYVRLIAPRFNRFTPLPEGELRQGITALVRECGFRAAALFTMDASRRSSHGNAYFIGFGRNKRIVLFDTLIDGSPIEEVRAIVAHELGHFRHGHILQGLLRSAVVLFVVLAGFGWLAHQPWLLPAFGIQHRDAALSLVACLLCWSLVGPLASLLGNWISRRHEFQADAFARSRAGAGPMIAALVRLSRDNASTLTPDPLYALYHYSHPPVPVRVARLRAEAAT